MNFLAVISLFLWLPIVVYIFVSRPSQRAVVVAFVFAWLFLPNVSWRFSGMPDYSKMSATVFGVMLCILMFDLPRLTMFRPRWYDLPMLIFCLAPFAASISTGAGPYDGVSASLVHWIQWGFPYLIGRIYFSDLAGIRQLALGIAVGGLVYTPFCLIELRMSPRFAGWVYGFGGWEGMRYGGYRPKVFLATGLELGMWMTCSTLVAQRLWACGTIKTIGGFSFGKLTLLMAVTTLLCRSAGAFSLLVGGCVILWMATRTRSSWPVWLLIAVVPFYTSTRSARLWSGREILKVVRILGEDRVQSLDYRFQNEDLLINQTWKYPIFGGSRTGSVVLGSNGRPMSVVDGYWIIIFSTSGLVGLSSLVAMMLLPSALFVRRYPASTWTQPEVGPASALAVLMVLIMIDDLSNAMLNPIHALVIGGLGGLPAAPRRGQLRESETSLTSAFELADSGHPLEAELSFRRAIELASDGEDVLHGLRVRAEALEGLGSVLLSADRAEEAEEVCREAVAVRRAIVEDLPETDHYRDLGIAHGRLGCALAQLGRIAEAIAERGQALEIWDRLAIRPPVDPDLRIHRANALNDLAWLLAAESDPALLDPPQAVRLADEAVRLAPDLVAGWNTLGVARYRAGDWAGAVGALERSVAEGPPGGTAFDHFFLAMAFQRLGDEGRARDSLGRAIEWSDRYRPGHPDLARFREEAVALLEKPRPTEVDVH